MYEDIDQCLSISRSYTPWVAMDDLDDKYIKMEGNRKMTNIYKGEFPKSFHFEF